jgi:multiple sugar transport system ATP-binding protein
MAAVTTRNIRKTFAEVNAVNGISLSVRDGEFMVLLGPSGCGKTTFLRIIAGLEKQTEGDVMIGGEVVNRLPPRARGIAMVFQSYGLYPHFSIRNNIAFPLRTQRVPKAEIARQVTWAARLLGIEHLLERRPRQLSGGERQRVALARALVRDPTVFLLDEPLSNLDAKLRTSARNEIRQFQQRVGTTTIYVTHDQVEAMGMGDRIAVIDHGQVRQVGTPAEIYDDPADRFVATFVGTPPMNLIAWNGGYLGFRPEQFLPRTMIDGGAVTEFRFRISRIEYLGSERIVYGEVAEQRPGQEVTAKLPLAHVPRDSVRPGDWHVFAVRDAALRRFDAEGRRMRPALIAA